MSAFQELFGGDDNWPSDPGEGVDVKVEASCSSIDSTSPRHQTQLQQQQQQLQQLQQQEPPHENQDEKDDKKNVNSIRGWFIV